MKRSLKPRFQCLTAENGQTPVWLEAMELTSLGAYLTLSIGESPSAGVESSLWQVLESNAPAKYYLSKKACEGIIRRADKRGKVLPKLLEVALLYRIATADGMVFEKILRKTLPFPSAAATLCASYGTKWNGNQGAYSGDNFVIETVRQKMAEGLDNPNETAVVFDGKQVTSKQNRSNPQPGSPCHTLAVGSCDSALCVKVCVPNPHGNGINDGIGGIDGAVGFDGYNGELTGGKASTLGINCGMATGRNGIVGSMKTMYGLCSDSSNSMKSPNPDSGIYEAATTRTLDSQGGNPSCNQGGMIIVETDEGHGKRCLVVLNDQGGESMSIEKSDISPTLRSETHGHLPIIAKEAKAVHESISGDRVYISDIAYALRSGRKPMLIEEVNLHPDIAPTLTASAGGTSRPGGGQGSELDYYIAYVLQGNMIGRADHNGPQGGGINENSSFTLNTTDHHAVAYYNHTHNHAPPTQGDTASCQTARQYKKTPTDLIVHKNFINMGMMSVKESEVANTQTARQCKSTLDYLVSVNANGGHSKYTEGIFGTLARNGGEMNGSGESLVAESFYIVRRLTPTECERLQGYPDDWTKYGADGGKEIADTPRYAMLGNSIAVPCVRFILKNIVAAEAKHDFYV